MLVDTDVFSFLAKGHTLAAKYEKHVKGKKMALSFITVGELLTWPKYKGWGETKTKQLESRIARAGVIPYDEELCRVYGDVRAQTLKMGRPVPDNDLWIAATAIRHSIPLISHNRKHYDEIPGLVLISETPKPIKAQMDLNESASG